MDTKTGLANCNMSSPYKSYHNSEQQSNLDKDILQYVSNLDRDIYSIFNLPEEIVATIFAYVSRSPKSFRENLKVVTEEKAKSFHEKWVLNYGHASVAELATVHIGIEKVSRLFSALLERANLYISPIEYSQRYQKPKKGDFYIPSNIDIDKKDAYIDCQNSIYDIYTKLFTGLFLYYEQNEKRLYTKSPKLHKSRLEKKAFEDARYILTLGVYTNLGLSANARACGDMLRVLMSSEYEEAKKRAVEIKKEVLASLPTLVKYISENAFLIKSREILEKESAKIRKESPLIEDSLIEDRKNINLLGFTGSVSKDPEDYALNIILSELLYPYESTSIDRIEEDIKRLPKEEKLSLYKKIFANLKGHDNPQTALEKVIYSFELLMSEACWHQFLRHRKIACNPQYPSISNGYIIPKSIKRAGFVSLFKEGIAKSEKMFSLLFSNTNAPLVAHYLVTNAHFRRVSVSLSLWELYHLINLRMHPNAQWEIQNLVEGLATKIKKVHPHLVDAAILRLIGRNN